jgi:hypothetical protein
VLASPVLTSPVLASLLLLLLTSPLPLLLTSPLLVGVAVPAPELPLLPGSSVVPDVPDMPASLSLADSVAASGAGLQAASAITPNHVVPGRIGDRLA